MADMDLEMLYGVEEDDDRLHAELLSFLNQANEPQDAAAAGAAHACPEGPHHGSNHASDSIIERTRAKNRRSQARYRSRQKEQRQVMELQIAQIQSELSTKHSSASELRDRNHRLVARCAKAAEELLKLRTDGITPAQPTAEASLTSYSSPSDLGAPETSRGSDGQTPGGEEAAPAQQGGHAADAVAVGSKAAAVVAAPRWVVGEDRHPREFPKHALISFQDVETALRDGGGCETRQINLAECFRSIDVQVRGFKEQAASRLGVAVSDVCWFCQQPLKVSDTLYLSHSTNLGSQECLASFLVYFLISLLELSLLQSMREHLEEALEQCAQGRWWSSSAAGSAQSAWGLIPTFQNMSTSATWSSTNGPCTQHCSSADSNSQVPRGAWGNATSSAPVGSGVSDGRFEGARVRCGADNSIPVRLAVRYALRRVLAPFQGRLPQPTLMEGIAALLAFMSKMGSPKFQDSKVGGVQLPKALWQFAATGYAADAHAGVIEELTAVANLGGCVAEEVDVGEEQQPEGLEDQLQATRARMNEVMCALLFSRFLAFGHDRSVTIRVLSFAVRKPGALSFAQVEQANMTLYTKLGFSSAQCKALSKLWEVWTAHRRATTQHMDALVRALRALPDASVVPTEFVAALSGSRLLAGGLAWLPTTAGARTLLGPQAGGSRIGHEALGGTSDVADWMWVTVLQRTAWAATLLGPSAAAVSAAWRVVQQVTEALKDEALTYGRTDATFLGLMSEYNWAQGVKLFNNKLHCVDFVTDHMRICQMAAQEHRRSSLLSMCY